MRKPTKDELSYINSRIAKKTMTEDDVYILDATPANDYMLTCYNYFLGSSSIFNFKNDLANPNVPMQVNHEDDIPMGTWLPGTVNKVQGGYELSAPVYMPKHLAIGKYSTNNLAMAYEAGTLTDVSVAWGSGKDSNGKPEKVGLICNICGKDVRDPKCEHMPGETYEGVLATLKVENAHLREISFVWKGGLPGAKLLKDTMQCHLSNGNETIAVETDWKGIKGLSIHDELCFTLSMPLPKVHKKENNDTGGIEEMKYEDVKEKFKNELAAEFVTKADHDLSLVDKEAEFAELTERFGDINAELADGKPYIEVGKKALDDMTAEYHRLGVALHGEKWNEESENDVLNALEVVKRIEHLQSKTAQMATDLKAALAKGKEKIDTLKTVTPFDNPKLYSFRKK